MWLHRRAVHLLLLLLPGVGGLLPPEAAGGTVPGLPCATPRLVADLVGAGGSPPDNLVDVKGTLYFTADTGATGGSALFKSDGTAPVLVKGPSAWPASNAVLSNLTAVGDRLFFIVSLPSGDLTLWRSDGSEAGTQPLRSFPPQFEGTLKLVALNGKLYFAMKDGNDDNMSTQGLELWMSDGTSGLTSLVMDISELGDSRPAELTVFQGKLFFQADDEAATGAELWMIDEGGVARQVADLREGDLGSNPTHLTVAGDSLYFFATDGSGNFGLWRLPGTPQASPQLVPSELASPLYSLHGNYTSGAGKTLFFTLSKSDQYGNELWMSDGTQVKLVKDIAPGIQDSSPELLTAVGETVFFLATDENSRQHLWRSDGTEAGTLRVPNFVPQTPAPTLQTLTQGPGVLLLYVDDHVWGSELWKVDKTGAYRLTDLSPGSGFSAPHGMTVSGGNLYFVATHPDFGEELFALPLQEVDCFAPALLCPGDQRVEAISAQGALFTSPPAAAFDDSLTGLSLSYAPPLQSQFPLGATPITATAMDLAGNVTTCSFEVKVVDTRPPLLLCPKEVRQEGTSLSVTPVNYSFGVSDAVSASPDITYTSVPPLGSDASPGSAFPQGETSVTITATDNENSAPTDNRAASCTFKVYVADTRAPRIQCPEDVVRIATSAAPIPVTFPVSAVDELSTVTVSASAPSGSEFPVGVTPVTITATDAVGNTSVCTFQVNHVDPVGPTITCPGPQQAVATEEEGARVDFPAASADDNLAPPTVSYSHEPGSTFPVGETIVTAEARDLGGRTATCTFPVTVEGGSSGCGCGAGTPGAGLGWLLLALAPLWARRRAARLGR
ncbi:MAG: HYR domain-containing protein [Myxococcaceae bacterium]|nr:HYR domain-containing protein [Myxococcaceae bacterium]